MIAIQPSRARSRQYLLDMTYFNWCVKNHVELVSVQLLNNILGGEAEDEANFFEGSLVTKETLEMAICLVNLQIIF